MINDTIRNAVRFALTAGVAASFVSAPNAFAADDEDATKLDRVEVTGSRIKRTQIEGAQPVTQVTREDIERTGLTSVGDLLQELPSAGSAINTNVNNGGDGGTYIDLRNLGSNRLLVLVNGRRWVPGLAGTIDTNTIPVSIIERVEVLKDGASSVYGSDAIAGVINIITRKDYDGMEASAYIGEFDEGDGRQEAYNISVGSTGSKSSVFVNASYTKLEPVFAGDREISKEPSARTGLTRGSSGSDRGRFFIYGGVVAGGLADLTLCDSVTETVANRNCGLAYAGFERWYAGTAPTEIREDAGVDPYNYAPRNYMATPQERTSVYVQAAHDLTDDISIRAEMLYARRQSQQKLAAEPLFIGGAFANPTTPQGDVIVSSTNPYNPFGFRLVSNYADWIASGGFYYSADAYLILVGRRLIEVGDRIQNQDVQTYAFRTGVEGGFEAMGRYFDWNVNYGFTNNRQNDNNFGNVAYARIMEALGDAVANPLSPTGYDCLDSNDGSNSGAVISKCVPLDLFNGPGSITPEMVEWISFNGGLKDQYDYTVRNYTANISGEVLDLPAGPLGVATGFEYRQESGYDNPDINVQQGNSSGNARSFTGGGYSVNEYYVEFSVPVLADAPMAEKLDLSIAARMSDYSTLQDSVTTTKFGFTWQPITDLLIRGTYSEGFRGPSIFETYQGAGDSFPDLADPCNSVDVGDPLEVYCGDNGVTVDGTFAQTNSQIRMTVGGNDGSNPLIPALTPEEATSTTFGVVWSPGFVDGLSITLDWYEIELTNAITRIGAQQILDVCAESWNTLTQSGIYCNFMSRGATGQVTDIQNLFVNIGGITVKGVDFNVNYRIGEVPFIPGEFRVVSDTSYVGNYLTINTDPISGLTTENDYVEYIGGYTAIPEIKSNLDIYWSYGDWEAVWNMRYIGGMTESCYDGRTGAVSLRRLGVCNLATDTTTASTLLDTQAENRLGATTYHDVQVSYFVDSFDTKVTFGLNNVFAKIPPYQYSAFANTFNPTLYELPGRFAYLRISKTF
jgi:outer membrane receptor protein involved in Fe transport